MNMNERNYLSLLKEIKNNGSYRLDRTGVGTKAIFGTNLKFDLSNNTFPLLTTKKMFIKGIIEETLFFLRGDIDTKILENKGVNIWKGNTSKEFLNKRGLNYLPEGSLGKGYSHQWRNFNGDLGVNNGVDQIKNVINSIIEDPNSRKHIVTAWNPSQLKEMALEPCHCFFQFFIEDDKISCQWYQRSVDTFLGLPFNIASYALITYIIGSLTNKTPDKLYFCGGDTHLYSTHFSKAEEQISRTPFEFPKIQMKKINTIEDMENLKLEDFKIENYISHPALRVEMAV